jgi:hypothetical protein
MMVTSIPALQQPNRDFHLKVVENGNLSDRRW